MESGITKRGRLNDRCVSGSVVVGGEDKWRQGNCQILGETRYYYLLWPPRSGGAAYSVGDGVLWRRRKGKLEQRTMK